LTYEESSVLLVETDALIRAAVSDYLRRCGYQVVEATNAAEAVQVLNAHPIQILVADLELKDASGFQLSATARNIRPEIEVIVTRSAERTTAAAVGLCKDGPLDRPYSPEHLIARIRQRRS